MSSAPFTVYSSPGGVAAGQAAIAVAWAALDRCALVSARPTVSFGCGESRAGGVICRFAVSEARGFLAIEVIDPSSNDFWEAFVITLPNNIVRTGWRRRGQWENDPPDVWMCAALELEQSNLLYHHITPDFHLLLGAGSYPQAVVNAAYLAAQADRLAPIDLRRLVAVA